MLRLLTRHRPFSTEGVSVDDFTRILRKPRMRLVDLCPPRFEPVWEGRRDAPLVRRDQPLKQRMAQKQEKEAAREGEAREVKREKSSRVRPEPVESFASFNKLDCRVVEALRRNNLVTPTAVQSGMFTEWFKSNNDLLVKAQTGTGKSVGYVALMYDEYLKTVGKRNVSMANGKFSPSNIIVVPNLILAEQLKRWLHLLTAHIDGQMAVDQAGLVRLAMTEEMDEPGRCSVLIGSGRALHRLLSTNQLHLDNLSNVIVDEADSVVQLLKRFAPYKERENRAKHPVPAQLFLEQLITMRAEARFLYASATMNHLLKHHLKVSRLARPGSVFIEAGDKPTAHLMDTHWECPRSIAHRYSVCDTDDTEALAAQISEIVNIEEGRQGIVIVPESVRRLPLLDMIRSFDTSATLLSHHLNPTDPPAQTDTPASAKILLGTEMDIRGLDIPALQYVVVVGECDGGVAGYVHAVGRVGRMGRPGTAYALLKGETVLMRYLAMLRHRLRVTPLPIQRV